MNKSRRKQLIEVLGILTKLKDLTDCKEALSQLQYAENVLENVVDEEQMAFESLPENMQWSARADVFTDNLDNLADAQVDLGLVVEAYQNAQESPYDEVKEDITSIIKNCTEAIERR